MNKENATCRICGENVDDGREYMTVIENGSNRYGKKCRIETQTAKNRYAHCDCLRYFGGAVAVVNPATHCCEYRLVIHDMTVTDINRAVDLHGYGINCYGIQHWQPSARGVANHYTEIRRWYYRHEIVYSNITLEVVIPDRRVFLALELKPADAMPSLGNIDRKPGQWSDMGFTIMPY